MRDTQTQRQEVRLHQMETEMHIKNFCTVPHSLSFTFSMSCHSSQSFACKSYLDLNLTVDYCVLNQLHNVLYVVLMIQL